MTAPATARLKADLILEAAKERKAFDLVLLHVEKLTSIADYFLICSGRSTRQVQALSQHIREQVKKTGGHSPLGVEGESQGQWVLMDYGEVIVHIFYEPVRELYDLESLWLEAERLDVGSEVQRPAEEEVV